MTSRSTALALTGLVLLTWAGSLQGAFHYDDFHSLVHNPAVRDVGALPDFFLDPRLFSVDADKSMYRPILLSTYALQYAAHQYQPSGFLAINIVIHLACVLLFWRLVVLLAPRLSSVTASLAAALFAVHPVMGEPINYVSSRSESLAAMCILAGLLLYLRAAGSPVSSSAKAGRLRAAALLAFAVGLLTKATSAVLPILIALREHRNGARRALLAAAPYLVILAGYMMWLSSRRLLPDDRAEPVRSLAAQLATQLKAVFWYVHLLSMPVHQSVDPAFHEGTWVQPAVWSGLALLLSSALLMHRLAGTGRSWWLLWPVVVALPASLIPLNVLVNEHRIYLASAGLCVPLAGMLTRVRPGWLWPGLVLLAVLSTLSMQRNSVWQSEKTLWAEAVAHAPESARARVFLGVALRSEGDLMSAGRQFEQAVRLEPGNLAALANVASVHYEVAVQQGAGSAAQLQAAESYYRRVLTLDNSHREALTNLGNVYRLRGDTDAAMRQYQRATEAHPAHPDAWANMAEAAFEAGNYGVAVTALQRVTQLEPTVAAGFQRLGDAFARGGDLASASAAYERGCQMDPNAMGACYNLAEVVRALAGLALADGDPEGARRLWIRGLTAYEHVLQRAGTFRQAAQRAGELRQWLAGGLQP